MIVIIGKRNTRLNIDNISLNVYNKNIEITKKERMNMKRIMNFEEFENEIITEYGASREATNNYGVSWILLKDEEGEEIFYAECNSNLVAKNAGINIPQKDDFEDEEGYENALDEIRDKWIEALDEYDEQFIKNAYQAYCDGEDEYYE